MSRITLCYLCGLSHPRDEAGQPARVSTEPHLSIQLHAQEAGGNAEPTGAAGGVPANASKVGAGSAASAGKKRPLLIVKTGELVASADQNLDPAAAGAPHPAAHGRSDADRCQIPEP